MTDLEHALPNEQHAFPTKKIEDIGNTDVESNDVEDKDFLNKVNAETPSHNIDDKLDFEEEGDTPNKSVISKGENSECDEDGQCSPEKKNTKEKNNEDGECSDGELEDGELKEENSSKKQVCRFFSRGLCFYGNVCRFLHLNNNKGTYNMFAPTPQYQNTGVDSNQHGHRSSSTVVSSSTDVIHEESAWERGLREAKELVKNANKRKQQPDFESKKMNLSMSPDDNFFPNKIRKEKEIRDAYVGERENFRGGYDPIMDYEAPSPFDPYGESTHMRFQREEFNKGPPRPHDREHYHFEERKSLERVGPERVGPSRGRGLTDFRVQEAAQPGRSEPKFFDPWRRSKSPTRRSASRSSFGSYSTVSSFSPSSYSSYSSCSRSSSRSRSPRSPPFVQEPFQRKQFVSQPHTHMQPAVGNMPYNKFPPVKRKFNDRNERPLRPRSIPRNRPPGRVFPNDRERERSPIRQRSRSRSISMDSITSSTSSSSAGSVTGKGHKKNDVFHAPFVKKQETEKNPEFPIKPAQEKTAFPTVQQAVEPPRPKGKQLLSLCDLDDEIDPLEDEFLHRTQSSSTQASTFSSLQHLLPSYEKPKEPARGLHKQPIKLTLLNKPAAKSTTLPKKELEIPKTRPEPEVSAPADSSQPKAPNPSPPNKKSANSRRVELLKQLKAVEDAIARKRAKFC